MNSAMKRVAFAAAALAGVSSPAFLAKSGAAIAASAPGIRLACSASGAADFSMAARYEERRGRKKFDASFEAAPGVGFNVGRRLAVSVGGSTVGAMTLTRDPANGDVIGDLEFDTNVAENNPFPANFPRVIRGTSVTVGSLGCALN